MGQVIPFSAGERPIDKAWRQYQQHTLMGRDEGRLDDLDWCIENQRLHYIFYSLVRARTGESNVIPFPRRA